MKTMQEKLSNYFVLDEKIEQEIFKYDDKLVKLWDQRYTEIVKLRGALIDYFKLFDMLPYFSKKNRQDFKEHGFVYTDITTGIDNYEILLSLKMDGDSVYVELNDVRIFDCLTEDIIAQEAKFKEVPSKVRNALKANK